MTEKYILNFLAHKLNTKGFELFPLAGDASARRYYRVVHGNQSYVLMCWEPFVDDDKYPFLSVLRHFNLSSIHVPKVIHMSASDGLILLEDLGDLTLERKFWEFQQQDVVLPFYRQAIDELIKIHFISSKKQGQCTAFDIEFDKDKLLWEMNYGRKHLLEDFCGIHFSEDESKNLDTMFSDICTRLADEPKYICHRDYHSRNLMLKLGVMRVIDFQDARMGPIQYDLVSLLHDSYVTLSESSQKIILDYYLEQAKPHLPESFDLDHFYKMFKLQTIQRCFKACGSFASFFNMREDRRYLKYLSKTLHTVAEELNGFEEYAAFSRIFDRNDLLGKDYIEIANIKSGKS